MRFSVWISRAVVTSAFLCLTLSTEICRAQSTGGGSDSLAKQIQPYLEALTGRRARFELCADLEVRFGDTRHAIQTRLTRFGSDSFDLQLDHADYAVHIRRREQMTALALPKHGVVFVGSGKTDEDDQLSLDGISQRLLTSRTSLSTYASMLLHSDADAVSAALKSLLGVRFDTITNRATVADRGSFLFDTDDRLVVDIDDVHLRVSLSPQSCKEVEADHWPGMQLSELPREELERTLVRGSRRLLEIVAPSKMLTRPSQRDRLADNGRLQWIDGQRVVMLEGSPSEIGKAHGQLLADEVFACIDSVLHTFGSIQTIRTGSWFRHDLDAAYARLSRHIPERHKKETRALARTLELDEDLLAALNVFPELFHCSGFAVFGKATGDGKLYHGRVLDYMTTIGLQDAATTFVVRAEGQIPFVNVGYAGFIGSVSGMNADAISLGEMGGGGEGEWDGVPMATLMRRALEECSTLDQVMNLWQTSPRTCEYYYVFADGSTNRAVGVAAKPESIEFIHPGQSHAELGQGIEDAVVLSAGQRLATLRQRVQEKHGRIDAEMGKWLMSRPVAMESNLHNVLFVPAEGVLYVANASHSSPAAECRYVRLDLQQLLQSMAPAGTESELSPVDVRGGTSLSR